MSDEVPAYLGKYELSESVRELRTLAGTVLPPDSELELSLRRDGESDETWLIVHQRIRSPRSEVLDHHNRLLDLWIATAAPAAQYRMHFTYEALGGA
ncbi:MAG: hypothetical protein U0791_08730 [Gemmataceae bacterium]